MMMLLVKITLLFAGTLGALLLLHRATAALRHLVCAMALSGALVLPVTLAVAPHTIAVHLPVVFRTTATSLSSASSAHAFSPLLALWATGTAGFLLRLAIGYWRIGTVVRTAERAEDPEPVFLAHVSAPLVCGLFRPAILLPRAAESWPLVQRAAAVRHELAHLERNDLWTGLIAHIACAVYWFHPLVWAVARQLRHEQETACDDAVLSAGFEPANYAEALVATARHFTSTTLIGCHMLTPQTLKSRIARLLDCSLPRTSSTRALCFTAALSIAILGSIGLIYADPQAAPDSNNAQEKTYRMADGVTAPHVILKVEPKYTEEAKDAKIQGTVMLSVVIGTDGLAHEINVVSTPDAGLGTKAVEAVQQWKFDPGTLNGEPVRVKATIEINFKLM